MRMTITDVLSRHRMAGMYVVARDRSTEEEEAVTDIFVLVDKPSSGHAKI